MSDTASAIRVIAGAYSAKGIRSRNEDAFLAGGEQGGGGIEDTGAVFSGDITTPLFFVVADGIGGHAAGDAAGAFVTAALKDYTIVLREASGGQNALDENSLEALIKQIHINLLDKGKKQGTPDMGSTLTGIVLQQEHCGYFNAGDSRTYRLRNGFILQLTRDDSLASVVPGAAKNIITNAVGAGLPDVYVASRFAATAAVPGDIFFMCSDGVHGFISDDDMEHILAAPFPAESSPEVLRETAKRIVEQAIANDSDDNCTALIVKIEKK